MNSLCIKPKPKSFNRCLLLYVKKWVNKTKGPRNICKFVKLKK